MSKNTPPLIEEDKISLSDFIAKNQISERNIFLLTKLFSKEGLLTENEWKNKLGNKNIKIN